MVKFVFLGPPFLTAPALTTPASTCTSLPKGSVPDAESPPRVASSALPCPHSLGLPSGVISSCILCMHKSRRIHHVQ